MRGGLLCSELGCGLCPWGSCAKLLPLGMFCFTQRVVLPFLYSITILTNFPMAFYLLAMNFNHWRQCKENQNEEATVGRAVAIGVHF